MDDENIFLVLALENYRKSLINVAITAAKRIKEISDEEEEEELFLEKKRKFITQNNVRITGYINDVVNACDNDQFQKNFRLKRTAFEKLLKVTSINAVEKEFWGRPQIAWKHQLLATIWLLATPDSYRSVSERFDIPKSVLSSCFVRVINAINLLMKEYIKWPNEREIEIIKNKFSRTSIFKNLIGVVDGTYVALSVPKALRTSYTNRQCFTSMTLQAICDADMRYLDIYCGWPSSVPDIRIFKNSDIYQESQKDTKKCFPNGEYILGDKAYPILE